MRRLQLGLLAAWAAAITLAAPAAAATFTVNSVADDPAEGSTSDGLCDAAAGIANPCTLRAAVQEANGTTGTDTIVVPDLGSPYALDETSTGEEMAADGDLDLRTNLTLQGSGQPVIDANGIDRVLHIGPNATGPAVTVSGLELREGGGVAQGAGILIESGSASLQTLTVTENVASGGAAGEGGGIWVEDGTAHGITTSTLNANQAIGATSADGGGIGVATGAGIALTNSSVSDNLAQAAAGTARGGGIWAAGGVGLTHVTMSRDQASGVIAQGGLVHAEGGAFSLRGTILNQGDADPGDENCSTGGGGTLGSAGGNLEALTVGAGIQCGLNGGLGDRVAADGGVTPLADRGGPTLTHALFNESPALDAIPSCFPVTADQRGEPRPGAFACDIGSFERQVLAGSGGKCFGREPTIVGFSQGERILGTPEDDVIVSDAGRDTIKAGEGNDRICAGKGNDRAFGGGGADRIEGEEGNDKLFGQDGKDRLLGVSGRDLLDGGKGVDRLDGGRKRDNCRASPADRVIDC